MILLRYFVSTFVTAYEEYLAAGLKRSSGRSRDLRAAIVAAEALYHFREHLPGGKPPSRSAIAKLCPDYNLVADVTNLAKHRRLTKGRPQLQSIEDIEELIVTTEYKDERGAYRHCEKVIMLKLRDGSQRDLRGVLTNVINFWIDELGHKGLARKRPHFALTATKEPRARSECDDRELTLEILQGLRFRQIFKLQQYNYDTGRVEPIDLTGNHARFTIRKPSYELAFSLTHQATGYTIERAAKLTDEESAVLNSLETSEAQEEYLASLPQVRQVLRVLTREMKAYSKAGRARSEDVSQGAG